MPKKVEKSEPSHSYFWQLRKKRKEQLYDAIESLSQTVGEQTAHVGLLARENNEHVRNLAIAAAKLEMLSTQYSKLEASHEALREELANMRSRLEETDRKLLETSMNARAMEGERETLTNTLQNQEDEIVELKTKISDLKTKKKSIAKAREILTKELTTKNESITKRDLEIAETNAHLDAALHDKELLNDAVSAWQNKHAIAEQDRGILQTALGEARAAQRNLEAENHCLRFNSVVLCKSIRKRREELYLLTEEKRRLLQYYARPQVQDVKDTDPYLVEKINLHNKILELESALYSRDQTIKELRMRLENHETSEDDSGLHEANNDNDDSLIDSFVQDALHGGILGQQEVVMTTSKNLGETLTKIDPDVHVYKVNNVDK